MAKTLTNPYDAGFDCGANGPDTNNCSIRWFATREMTAEWERGKASADSKKSEFPCQK